MGSSWTKPLADGRIVVVSAAGEDEVDGAYVEMAKPVVSNKEKRPSFVYAGRTRGHADIVMWWVDSAAQWTIGKFPRSLDVASSSKTWYIASAATGADVAGPLPPSTGWAVSAKAPTYGGVGIGPAPQCQVLAAGAVPPPAALGTMFVKGVGYAANGE